jgi:hypothetical protein
MLSIKDHVIANTLFDQRRIESILLLPDMNVGREIVERNSTSGCSEAFLMNGDQLLGKPSYRMYACRNKEARYFMKLIGDEIKYLVQFFELFYCIF